VENLKQKTSNLIYNIAHFLIVALLAGAQSYLLWQIWKLNMLPGKYFLILCGVCLVLTAIIGLLFRRKQGKWQKKAGYGRQIAALILSLLLLAGCFFGSRAVSQLRSTIGAITNTEKVNVLLEIYVRQEDSAQYLQDTAGYTFAMAQDVPEDVAEEMRKNLEHTLGETPEILLCAGTVEAVDKLLSGDADALILDNAYLLIFEGMEGYEDVESRIRVLHEYVIEKEEPRETEPTQPEKVSNEKITEHPFLVYISGSDSRREMLANGGSDVNILMVVNPVDHQILLVNTPRDYYVVNPASGNGSKDKLSHCGLGGIDNCIITMESLYDISIDYYAKINFNGFKTLIDAIGGVTVYSERDFYTPEIYIYKGENYLNGTQALAFVRERKNLPNGDNDRGKNQMRMITAMIDQLSVDNLIANYSEILESLEGLFATSMPAEDIGRLVQLQLTQMPSWDVKSFAVTGSNGTDKCWARGTYYAYVMYPHEHMVNHATDLINRVLAGEVITDDDLVVNP
jgi:LCP family protein required for cell wall assembly